MSNMQKHFYGWLPDKTDTRDHIYQPKVIQVPVSIDLRSQMPPVYDQGQLGSCTANAIAAALDYQRVRQSEKYITPSRLFIYYNERKDDRQIQEDAGATIRESVKAVKNYGACPELEWPYDISKFTLKPSKKAYQDALSYQDLTYERINPSVGDIQNALAAGYPIVVGISVYESFENAQVARTGDVPFPQKGERLLGGHAVLVVGYMGSKWIVRNSWGEQWGDRGYFHLPEEYLTHPKLSGDFWALTKVK